MKKSGPLLLAILDGWGLAAPADANAVSTADTPNMDLWLQEYPWTSLTASGPAVGLPAGQMGNSEVGHLNIGAGRIVHQDFSRINQALADETFFENQVLVETMREVKGGTGSLHLLGLLSDGGVHSHLDHLIGLVEMAARFEIDRIFIHAFMDGRDTPPHSGRGYMERLLKELARIGVGKVASISGRYYAMDRDNRWERVKLAWDALVHAGGGASSDPLAAIARAYDQDQADEFIRPVVITGEDGSPVATVGSGDSVIFYNFRSDRARQLTHAFNDDEFDGFARGTRPNLLRYVTFTTYDKNFGLPVAFPALSLKRILGEEVSRRGLTQLRIAETEKYAHVTFFFNGGREPPYEGEDRVLVPSPQEVATYDQKPEMSAGLVTRELLDRLAERDYDLIVLNFANGDMVGHSGVLAAAIEACEVVDGCLGRLVEAVLARQGRVLITADHGNAEQMKNPDTGEPFTAHTANLVPLLLIDREHRDCRLAEGGALKDIAPTILGLMGIPVPAEMEGRSLLRDKV